MKKQDCDNLSLVVSSQPISCTILRGGKGGAAEKYDMKRRGMLR